MLDCFVVFDEKAVPVLFDFVISYGFDKSGSGEYSCELLLSLTGP